MKIQNLTKTAILAVIGGIAMANSASATLVINTSTAYVATLSSPPGTTGADRVATAVGTTEGAVGDLLYKINADGSEEGTLKDSYSTSPAPWQNSSGDAIASFPIIISYGSGQIASPATYLLVKDGNLGSFIFDLSSSGLDWNGTEDIAVYNLFAFGGKQDAGGTSHIEFFGSKGSTTSVPEPSTIIAGALLLLPFGVSTLRILRKNRTA